MISTVKFAASMASLFSKTRLWAKRAWAWIKVNGHVVFLVASGIIVLVVTRKSVDFSKILGERKKAYEDEISTLKDSHEKEIRDREAAAKRYRTAIKQIEEKFTSDSRELEKSKKAEIKKLIEKNADNPDEITRKIAEITGFDVVDLD